MEGVLGSLYAVDFAQGGPHDIAHLRRQPVSGLHGLCTSAELSHETLELAPQVQSQPFYFTDEETEAPNVIVLILNIPPCVKYY